MSPPRRVCLAAGLLVGIAGCAETGGSFLSQRTGVGSLKTSLSQLEFENQQLKKQVATLKDENRQIENRLVQEEAATGDLQARLDDAKSLLGQRGLDGDESLTAGSGRKTLPAGQSSRKRRKTPFAQIPGRIDVLPPTDEDTDGNAAGWSQPSASRRDDVGPLGSLERSPLWLPVARGATDPGQTRR